MSKNEPCVVHQDDCPVEGWGEPGRSGVQWWTLLSADRTPTDALTVGIAELAPSVGEDPVLHSHAQPEVYYILSGEGVVIIGGTEYPIRVGSTIFIPGNVEHGAINIGPEPLRLLYIFATDSFTDVRYEFPAAS